MNTLQSDHPKFRTKLCRNFASGSCPFGPACSFVHDAPRTSPPSPLSRVQHLFPWNVLLPQLIAFSKQYVPPKDMMPPTQSSSPRPQDPQLVDEDPSASTSLLLSTSDCSSPGQTPQRRQPSKLKKHPCRHFVRTGGWCPAGEQCNFLHDVTALPSEGIGKAAHAPPSDTNTYGEQGRPISGGVLIGTQVPSPPMMRREILAPSRYTETDLAQRSLQPLYWPSYAWQPYYTYYPATAAVVPMPVTTVRPSVLQPGNYHPSQPQAQTVPPREAETSTRFPQGMYQVNGTTYFPGSVPSVPVPVPAAYSTPSSAPYSRTMVPVVYPYAWYGLPTLPSSYYNRHQTTDTDRSPTCMDPFPSNSMMPSEPRVNPRHEDHQILPPDQQGFALPAHSPPSALGPSDNVALAATTTSLKDKDEPKMITQEHEFPYQPQENQRVGHARRISVNIKKQG